MSFSGDAFVTSSVLSPGQLGSAVYVAGANIERSTAGAPGGVTITTGSALVRASSSARRSILITNNGLGGIYLGRDSTVATTGSSMGIKLYPGGSYSDSGEDLYTGDIYAIGDMSSSVPNVSSWERT